MRKARCVHTSVYSHVCAYARISPACTYLCVLTFLYTQVQVMHLQLTRPRSGLPPYLS